MKHLKIFISLLVSIMLIGCSNKEITTINDNINVEVIETTNDKVLETLANMSLEEKIAQMFVINHKNNEIDDEFKKLLSNTPPGGFILMGNNFTTYNDTLNFIKELQNNSKTPLIISTDQEGGRVERLKNLKDVIVTHIPDMYDLGSTHDEAIAFDVGRVIGEELSVFGIHVDYAPVLDIYSNPNNTVIGKRSFGSESSLVSKMAISLNKGLLSTGVIGVYKHFPGHGDTEVDSHISLPIINKTYEELKSNELIPFQNAIEADAKIIMVGHIALPKITGDNTPASLSKIIVTDILKGDMGFNGLVISDALDMGALTKNYSKEEILTLAIAAGVDLLLIPGDVSASIDYIKKHISEDRIDASVKKILEFKYNYLDFDNYLDVSYLGSHEHKNIVSKVSQ